MMRCYQCLHWYLGECDYLSKGVSPNNEACSQFSMYYCQKNIDTVAEWELKAAILADEYLGKKDKLKDSEVEWSLWLSSVMYSIEKFLDGAQSCCDCRRKDCLKRDSEMNGGEGNSG